jgi:hypothetical protein
VTQIHDQFDQPVETGVGRFQNLTQGIQRSPALGGQSGGGFFGFDGGQCRLSLCRQIGTTVYQMARRIQTHDAREIQQRPCLDSRRCMKRCRTGPGKAGALELAVFGGGSQFNFDSASAVANLVETGDAQGRMALGEVVRMDAMKGRQVTQIAQVHIDMDDIVHGQAALHQGL